MAKQSLAEAASSQALAERKTTALVTDDVPDFLKDSTSTRGTEGITMDKMVIPRLAIAQTLSDQRKKSSPKFIPDLEDGMIFNSLSQIIYDRPVKIIPLFFYTSRIHFKPMAEGGGIICQAPDGVHCQLNNGGPCLHQKWGPGGEKPKCTEFFNFAVMLPEHDMESLVLSLKSSGIGAAKQLNSLIRARKKDAFAGVYAMDTFFKKEGNQEWYEPLITNAGWADQTQYKFAEESYDGMLGALKSGAATFDAEYTAAEPGANSGDEM